VRVSLGYHVKSADHAARFPRCEEPQPRLENNVKSHDFKFSISNTVRSKAILILELLRLENGERCEHAQVSPSGCYEIIDVNMKVGKYIRMERTPSEIHLNHRPVPSYTLPIQINNSTSITYFSTILPDPHQQKCNSQPLLSWLSPLPLLS
jgi:hypothetical protein